MKELRILVESTDEGICRKLIAFLKQCKAVYGDGFKQFGLDIDDALAWLENQGEQKPTECSRNSTEGQVTIEPQSGSEKAGNREQLSPEMKALLNQKVEELDLSVRTRNILKANGIDTILDICRLKRIDCLNFRNGGKRSLAELDDFLTAHNLTWGMNV